MKVPRVLALCCVPLLLLAACQKTDAAPPKDTPVKPPKGVQAAGYTILEPVTYKNLTIFLIEGDQTAARTPLLTLQEALEQKKIVVHETGDVNELAVENLSDKEEVYIQSGDIIKGGRQDRVFETDFIVPRKSGKMPIPAFCVEQGRWSQRRDEASDRFSSSNQSLASKDLKLAAKYDKEQQSVWSKVEAAQEKLGGALGAPVRSAESASSLQLTLENDQLNEIVQEYRRHLEPSLKGNRRVIGYAFAINGQINSADVYGSHDLFKKLWPKLLTATATEAVSEKAQAAFVPAESKDLALILEEMSTAKEADEETTARLSLVKRESKKNVVFESRDKDDKSRVLHRNYIVK